MRGDPLVGWEGVPSHSSPLSNIWHLNPWHLRCLEFGPPFFRPKLRPWLGPTPFTSYIRPCQSLVSNLAPLPELQIIQSFQLQGGVAPNPLPGALPPGPLLGALSPDSYIGFFQLMPSPPIICCFIEIQNGLPFWCQLTQVVLEKGSLNGCSMW